jgi:NADH:ubiquinone oxidoreductase subunit
VSVREDCVKNIISILCSVNRASKYPCNETNWMHYLASVYPITMTVPVSGLLVAHHQDVTIYIYIYICDSLVRVVHRRLTTRTIYRIYAWLLPDDTLLVSPKHVEV